jgi:hypothetical protein
MTHLLLPAIKTEPISKFATTKARAAGATVGVKARLAPRIGNRQINSSQRLHDSSALPCPLRPKRVGNPTLSFNTL